MFSPICVYRSVLRSWPWSYLVSLQLHFLLALWTLLYLLLKLCVEPASTTFSSKSFHFSTTLRLKKYFLTPLWLVCTFNFQQCPWVPISHFSNSLPLSALSISLSIFLCYITPWVFYPSMLVGPVLLAAPCSLCLSTQKQALLHFLQFLNVCVCICFCSYFMIS